MRILKVIVGVGLLFSMAGCVAYYDPGYYGHHHHYYAYRY